MCAQAFGEDSELQSHIKQRHTSHDEKDFFCQFCPYATSNKYSYQSKYIHLSVLSSTFLLLIQSSIKKRKKKRLAIFIVLFRWTIISGKFES